MVGGKMHYRPEVEWHGGTLMVLRCDLCLDWEEHRARVGVVPHLNISVGATSEESKFFH